MRSAITSLLFLLLTIGLVVQFAFTITNHNIKKVRDKIDTEYILNLAETEFGGIKLQGPIRELALEYIDGYADYVFSKRSYPSLQTLDMKDLSDEEKIIVENVLAELQKKIDLKYETVLKIRETSNFMTNGSIYLLINIGTILIFLFLTISLLNFKKALLLFGIAFIASSLINVLAYSIIFAKIKTISTPLIRLFALSIFSSSLTVAIYKTILIYMLIGLILFFSIYVTEKILKKRQIQTK